MAVLRTKRKIGLPPPQRPSPPPVVPESDTISLHFGLKDGSSADLEIISAAAIAWVETLRAAAQAIDPASDVRVELIDVDHSSAIYNIIADWFERNVDPSLARLKRGSERGPAKHSRKALLGLTLFTITTAVPTYQAYFGDSFKAEDRQREERIEEKLNKSIALETARRKFFRVLEREKAITSVSIREQPNSEPLAIVKSEDFPVSGGLFSPEAETAQERITTNVVDVVLVKPTLLGTPRTWTFKPDGLSEFDAVMRDAKVLRAIRDRELPVKFHEGERMTLRIEAREVLIDGRWKLVRGGRSVMRVIQPKID